MKKSVIVIALLAVILSSCGFHTCATYAKNPQKKEVVKKYRI
jgi:PBP1b-binding outer membrane lipoprotein LpoB